MCAARKVTTRPKARGRTADVFADLVAHLRKNRTRLREEWVRRIEESQLLTAMTEEEILTEATSIYDNYVDVLETGAVEALQAYARNLSERIIPRGVETHEVIGIVLLLRDVLLRSLLESCQSNFDKVSRMLDAYEPAARRITITVAAGFVRERERIIRQQQDFLRSGGKFVIPIPDLEIISA